MIDEKEVLKALVCRANDLVVDCTGCPYRDRECEFICDFQRICRDTLALLKERGPKVKPQFDDDALDRNAYIKVGDLIDCMTELSMLEDAAFHLTGAIEWACGKRAVALPKEQEARVMAEGDVLHSTGKPIWFESRGMYLSKKGFWILPFEVDPELHIRFVQSVTGGKITFSLIDYGKVWRCWTARPTEEQMRKTPWEGEKE